MKGGSNSLQNIVWRTGLQLISQLVIRVGIVGYGYAGKTFHAPLIGATADLALSIIASRDPLKVHADLPNVKVVADPLELLNSSDVDLVVIASPNDTIFQRLSRTAPAADGWYR